MTWLVLLTSTGPPESPKQVPPRPPTALGLFKVCRLPPWEMLPLTSTMREVDLYRVSTSMGFGCTDWMPYPTFSTRASFRPWPVSPASSSAVPSGQPATAEAFSSSSLPTVRAAMVPLRHTSPAAPCRPLAQSLEYAHTVRNVSIPATSHEYPLPLVTGRWFHDERTGRRRGHRHPDISRE